MNKKTLKALKGSIRKWEGIVEGTGEDDGTENCPLCMLDHDNLCEGCIICEKTGHIGCDKTPYEKWNNHYRACHTDSFPRKVQCVWCKKYAKEELKFLKSILPSKELKS